MLITNDYHICFKLWKVFDSQIQIPHSFPGPSPVDSSCTKMGRMKLDAVSLKSGAQIAGGFWYIYHHCSSTFIIHLYNYIYISLSIYWLVFMGSPSFFHGALRSDGTDRAASLTKLSRITWPNLAKPNWKVKRSKECEYRVL